MTNTGPRGKRYRYKMKTFCTGNRVWEQLGMMSSAQVILSVAAAVFLIPIAFELEKFSECGAHAPLGGRVLRVSAARLLDAFQRRTNGRFPTTEFAGTALRPGFLQAGEARSPPSGGGVNAPTD